MLFKEGPRLDELITALMWNTPADPSDWKSLELAPARMRQDGDAAWLEPPIVAWYPSSVKVTPAALSLRIRKALEETNHASTDAISKAILGLVCIRRAMPSSGAAF